MSARRSGWLRTSSSINWVFAEPAGAMTTLLLGDGISDVLRHCDRIWCLEEGEGATCLVVAGRHVMEQRGIVRMVGAENLIECGPVVRGQQLRFERPKTGVLTNMHLD